MFVKRVVLFRLLLVVLLAFSAMFSAYAESTCEATNVFYEKVAQQVETELEKMKEKLNNYNTLFEQTVSDIGSPCYELNTRTINNIATPYDWSSFDVSGAELAESHKDRIKQLMSEMKNMFNNIDVNLSDYEFKNEQRISAKKVAMNIPGADKQQLENDLKIFQQCKVNLFNLKQEQSAVKDLRSNALAYLTTLAKPQTTTCSCDETGTLKSCSTISETPEEVATKDLSCKNLNEEVQDTSFCITCTIFERILMADQKLAKGAFGVLSDGFIKILAIGFLIYLALQTLTLVSSPSNQPINKYLTAVTIQAFKILIAVFILSNPEFLYNIALKPILEGSLDFGITLTGEKQAAILEAGTKYTNFDTSDTLLSAPFLQKMVGAADAFSTKAAIMPAMGKAMVCNAFTNLDWNVIPNIETLLEGVMVVIFGYIISLSIGFYLLDLTLELGFICCLLPFLVACWPFKLTSSYVKVGWNIFMHIFFNFVMLGIVITVINTLVQKAISPGDDISVLINALNNNDFDTLKKIMDIGGIQILTLVVCCYISVKLLKDVQNLSNKFAGGAGLNISPVIGGLAMSAAASFGKAGGAVGFKGLAKGVDAAKEIGAASGLNGAIKDTLGFNKMQKFAAETKASGKDLFSRTLGKAGIGSKAVEHGGRHDAPTDINPTTNGGTDDAESNGNKGA